MRRATLPKKTPLKKRSNLDRVFRETSFVRFATIAEGEASQAINQDLLREHQGCTFRHDAGFLGLTGPIADVRKTLLGGWPEGVSAMEKAGEGLRLPPIPSIRRRVKYGPQGDELDIHAVRNGRLERAWRSTPRQSVTGPSRVHLVVNISANAGVSADQLHWRGAAGLALAKALTAAGYSVRIDAAITTKNTCEGQERFSAFVTVKDYAARLNVSALAGMVAHPAAFRRLGFAYMIAQGPAQVNRGLGTAYEPSLPELREGLHVQASDKVLEIPQSLLSERDARRWLQACVTDLLPNLGRH